jgi:hypothetical protein
MDKRIIAAFGVFALAVLPGCPGDDTAGDNVIDQDTMLVESVDTIQAPIEVPVHDTVVERTTIDTIGEGEAEDTVIRRP